MIESSRNHLAMLLPALLLVGLVLALRSSKAPSGLVQEVIGTSVEGRPIEGVRFGSKTGGVLFLGSIHGSEGAGTPLLEALIDHLTTLPWRGDTVWVLPITNPDGLAKSKRFNARGIDLNRNFPAENRQASRRFGAEALSEPESQALYALIEQWQPRVIVSVHQPIACVDYDGPPEAAALAARMAEHCLLPVKKLGSRPGSLGAYFGETLGRPIITLELPDLSSTVKAKLWKRYGQALLAALEKAP